MVRRIRCMETERMLLAKLHVQRLLWEQGRSVCCKKPPSVIGFLKW